MHYTQEERPPGWEEFVRDNAVSLVEARNHQIENYRKIITKHEKSRRDLRGLVKGLRQQLIDSGLTPVQ